jgi:hypothetical protein
MIHRSLWTRLFGLALLIVAAGLVGGCALATVAGKVVTAHPCDSVTCPAGEVCSETATGTDNMSNVKAICAAPMIPAPGQQCSTADAGLHAACWHDPDGQGWRYRCGDGETDAAGPEGCPVPPVAPPVTRPAQCLPDQATWVQSTSPGEMAPTVQAALDTYRTEHPEAFEEGGGRLADHRAAAVDALYDGLGVVLARSGACGGQIRNDGERGDKLGVLRKDGQVEAFHVVEYGGYRLQSPIRTESVWRAPAAAPASPAGPAATSCPPPVPLRTYEDGNPHWFMRCKPHVPAGVIDCTPKVQGQPDFCEAVFGKRDLNCDLGIEGDPARDARERYLYGSTRVESRDGAQCGPYGENPMQFWGHGGCRLCSTVDPVVCGEWF